MFEKQIEAAVEAALPKALDRRAVRPDHKLTLEGYHPLPEIMGSLYAWLMVPFRGAEILVEVRYPRSTQLPDVDKLYSVITEQKSGKKVSRQDIIDIMNIQEECCKAVLNRPTFTEIEQAVYGKDHVLEANKKLLEELRGKLKDARNDSERMALNKEIDRTELFTGYILPDDTMLALTNIALGADVSDIKKLTKNKLILAYNKSRLYGGRPSDFVPGLFTDRDRGNIDDYATILGGEEEVHKKRKAPKKRPERSV